MSRKSTRKSASAQCTGISPCWSGKGLSRSPGKNNRENVYRYVSLGACEDKLHITCLKCGRTTHMTQKISDKLLKDVLRGDKFDIDLSKTTVYGVCKDCR